MIFCHNCNAMLPDDAKFCSQCGVMLFKDPRDAEAPNGQKAANDPNAPKTQSSDGQNAQNEGSSFGDAAYYHARFDGAGSNTGGTQEGGNTNGSAGGGSNTNGNTSGNASGNAGGSSFGGGNGERPSFDPFGGNYNPYGYNPGGYNAGGYGAPGLRPLNVPMLIFSIVNILLFSGLLGIIPLVITINARKATSPAEEKRRLRGALIANIVLLIVGLVWTILLYSMIYPALNEFIETELVMASFFLP